MNKSLRNILFMALLVIVVVYGSKYLDLGIPDFVPTGEPEVSVPATVPPTLSVSDSYFSAYFTNPPLASEIEGIERNLIYLIDNAKASVHGAVYELDLENVTEALIKAKRRGVDVRLVYDSEAMSKDERVGILKRLGEAGVPLIPDERSALMHNKFLVIDGETVWTGSFNLTQNAAHRNNENAVIIRIGFIATNYEREFREMFDGKFGATSPADTPYPVIKFDSVEIETYFAPEDNVAKKIDEELKAAEYSVDFLSFSFTDVGLSHTMAELALEDDVSVRGVFDSNQSKESSVCSILILRSGNIEGNGSITVKLDGNPGLMHEKVIVIDNETVIFGSFNFSRSADESNDENLLIVHDPELARLFASEFEKVFDQGTIPNSECKKQ
jgi:phosphatidylserine/phosphatidylglycerophosphate/cardiolipin synthase-like enzyme